MGGTRRDESGKRGSKESGTVGGRCAEREDGDPRSSPRGPGCHPWTIDVDRWGSLRREDPHGPDSESRVGDDPGVPDRPCWTSVGWGVGGKGRAQKVTILFIVLTQQL